MTFLLQQGLVDQGSCPSNRYILNRICLSLEKGAEGCLINALTLVTREEGKERDRTKGRNRRRGVTVAPLHTHTHTHTHTHGVEKGREIISVLKEFLGESSPDAIFS